MPSPFPGMDPYLEEAGIWPGFYNRFAGELCAELNGLLPAGYYADVEERAELGIVEQAGTLMRIVPDILVVRRRAGLRDDARNAGPVALATRPRREVSPHIELEALIEPIRHLFVEIREAARGHKLVTVVEILSPSNKRPGPDRDAYEAKRREVLRSDANLIELDLLRGGRRVLTEPGLEATIARLEPSPAYLVLVNRAARRTSGAGAYHVYPVGLRESLPCIAVPLKKGEDEVPLDLQYAFDRTYDTGPYQRGAVDYAESVPSPSLDEEDSAWASDLTGPWREPRAAAD